MDKAQIFALGVTIGMLSTTLPKQCNLGKKDRDILVATQFRNKDMTNVLPILVVARHQDLASGDAKSMGKAVFDKIQDYFEVGIVELWEHYKKNGGVIHIEKLVDDLLDK